MSSVAKSATRVGLELGIVVAAMVVWAQVLYATVTSGVAWSLIEPLVSDSRRYALERSLFTRRPPQAGFYAVIGDSNFISRVESQIRHKPLWPLTLPEPTLPNIAIALEALKGEGAIGYVIQNRPYFWTDHWSSRAHSYGLNQNTQLWLASKEAPKWNLLPLASTKAFFTALMVASSAPPNGQETSYPESLRDLSWNLPPLDKNGWDKIEALEISHDDLVWVADTSHLPDDLPEEISQRFKTEFERNAAASPIGKLALPNSLADAL